MKLKKIKLNKISDSSLDERKMCRVLGGGTPGCCQCGCNYASAGGSSTANNDSANNAYGYVSDYGAQPCCNEELPNSGCGIDKPDVVGNSCEIAQSTLCPGKNPRCWI